MQLLYEKNPENAPAHKLLAAAAYLGVPLTPVPVEDASVRNKPDPAHPDPCGAYPLLDVCDGSGTMLFGANAILRFLARQEDGEALHAYGRTPFEASQVDMWIDFAGSELDRANAPYIYSTYEQKQQHNTSSDSAEALAAVEEVLAGLEEVLSIRTFLVGERLSIADVAVAFSVQWVYRCNPRHGDALANRYRAVYRHYNTIMRHPKIREVLRKEGATLGPLRS